MSETAVRRTGRGSLQLSRRQVLKAGIVAMPCLLGARTLFDWTAAASEGLPADAAELRPIQAAIDPSTHRWGFIVDTRSCIGCGLCVAACKEENGVPEEPTTNRTWVERHVVAADGSVTIDSPAGGISGFPPQPAAPAATGAAVQASYFVPRLCMQCENPPCVSVCPVSATYRTADGVVLVDEKRCLGCGYCVVACPYGARYLVPSGGQTPTGIAGVADKCTFCYHRIGRGLQPACVEVCPTRARAFGDLEDPSSDVSTVLREQRVQVMKPELGTKPQVFYLGLEAEES